MATKDLSLARLAQPHPAEPALVISSASDEELITLMKSGRGEALSALFDRYFRLVLCVALRILRDTREAEDLMQDVFLEIYKRACLFDAGMG